MNFRRLLVVNFVHYSSGTDLLVSVAESRLTASKDFPLSDAENTGNLRFSMGVYFLYQEWQGILVPV